MTHEFKNIVEEAFKAKSKGLKSVLATVVALDGSSYRKPGVRMLILENDAMVGAVSGGCVEKEVLLQSKQVFKTGASRIMTYDGRYRLGCEGVLYILLELFNLNSEFEASFFQTLKSRINFQIKSSYKKLEGVFNGIGSCVFLNDKVFSISKVEVNLELQVFSQILKPLFKLVIIGAEHDAVELCKYAALTGWEVTVVSGVSELKSIKRFPGANSMVTTTPEAFNTKDIDSQTAIVLMTHNFAYDLRYLVALKETSPNYIGLLGSVKRRDDLLNQFIEYCPNISDTFLDVIHGPAGLSIGSITPQEIAVSIISEILAYTRHKKPLSLSKKEKEIHSK
ncbi:XdhC/CoxI family protein [Tamlana sp. 62-3]|uniref:XdhC/CoxI family protein n=1 Tax=Neotamlana sargassicola TaxID=2883125 RepID=A0A9X1I5J8_9FLAO|nr:XdhC/CoxI family protein [Tamlana sargassicola]MCB4808256.1 XdhC/CoxI family protein [Tamlana sargassicola]